MDGDHAIGETLVPAEDLERRVRELAAEISRDYASRDLLLVGVLFIGIQAWRDGANKSACLVNLSSIQKAVRGYQNVNLLNVGDAVTGANLTTAGYFGALPTCPVGATAYTLTGTVPAQGTSYAACASTSAAAHNPKAAETANW